MTTEQKILELLLRDKPSLEDILMALETDSTPGQARSNLYHITRHIHRSTFPPISQMELVLTEGCNLACRYCFEKEMRSNRLMSIDVGHKAVDLLIDYSADEPDLHIALFGGEPMLNMRVLTTLTEYAEQAAQRHDKNLHFNMTTNGVLINDQKAEYFSTHHINVMISIDGMQASNDLCRVDKQGRSTFQRTLNGITILKKYQPWIGVKMTVMPANVKHLYEDVVGLYHLGVNQFTIGHATGTSWPEDTIRLYSQQMAQLLDWYKNQDRDSLSILEFEESSKADAYFGCQAGRSSISVSTNGEVSPCSKILALNSKHLISKLGDVDTGLYLLKNRTDLVLCQSLKANCKSMGIKDDYQGGCFAVNYDESGSLFMPSLQEHRLNQALG